MTHRVAARVVGVLFVMATVPVSLSVIILEPVLGSPEFLEQVALSQGRVGAGILLELVNHIAVVGIAVVVYPVLKPVSERLALGYAVARSIEAALFAIGTWHLLTLVFVGQEFVAAGASAGQHFETLGAALIAGHNWDNAALPFTAFGLGALILYYTLYHARLVPRWIAAFGLLAALSILTARVLILSGLQLSSATVALMDGPIFLQEMVFAAWLIFRGFNPAAPEGTDGGARL
jgi:hypothetical protein